MRHALTVLCLLSIAYWATGCSGPLVRDAPDASAPTDFPGHTAEQIVYRLAQAAAGVRAFRSEAHVAFDTPEGSQHVGASLRALLADSVYASLRGPLGINVGRGLVTADSFFAYDQLNGRLYLGPLGVADAYVPGAGTPGALSHTLLGLLVPDPTETWEVRADSTTYFLTEPEAGADGLRRRFIVDPALWRVTALETFAPDGTAVTRRLFSAFDVVEGVVVPRRVVLAAPLDSLTVTVEHRQLTLDPTDLDITFRRPSDAEVIPLAISDE